MCQAQLTSGDDGVVRGLDKDRLLEREGDGIGDDGSVYRGTELGNARLSEARDELGDIADAQRGRGWVSRPAAAVPKLEVFIVAIGLERSA